MKKKILTLTVAILVLAFSLLSFTACTFDKTDDVPSDVFDEVIAMDDAGTSMYQGKSYDMPRALKFYCASPNSAKTVRLTASISPVTASDKSVDWSLSWSGVTALSLYENWSVGKNVSDYVTVTPTSDGALTADVTFLQNFGETIVLTVTSRSNNSAFTTCNIDCCQDLSNINYLFRYIGFRPQMNSDADAKLSFVAQNQNTLVDIPFLSLNDSQDDSTCDSTSCRFLIYGGGTSYDSYPFSAYIPATTCHIEVKLEESVFNYLNWYYRSNIYYRYDGTLYHPFSSNDWMVVTGSYSTSNELLEDPVLRTSVPTYSDFFACLSDQTLMSTRSPFAQGVPALEYNIFYDAFQRSYYDRSVDFYIRFVMSFDEFEPVTLEYGCRFTPDSLGLTVQNVSLNSASILY